MILNVKPAETININAWKTDITIITPAYKKNISNRVVAAFKTFHNTIQYNLVVYTIIAPL